MVSLGLPGDLVGDMWRLADVLREYRGDAHTAAWTSAGLDATEIGLLSELYWGLPPRSYIRTRAWSDEQLEMQGQARLRLRGVGPLAGDALSPEGRTVRESIERTTDAQCEVIVDALEGAADELIGLLAPWGKAIRDAGGYPPQGPHDLAPVRA